MMSIMYPDEAFTMWLMRFQILDSALLIHLSLQNEVMVSMGRIV